VLKALWENDLMPRTICGSSVGSLIAGGLASKKYSNMGDIFDSKNGYMCGKFLGHKFDTYFEAI
jgi:predicted acylesterase/phospholipase RssA